MKTIKKNILLTIISVLVFTIIGILAGNIVYSKNYRDQIDFEEFQSAKWIYNVSDFSENRQSYEAVVKFINTSFTKYLKDGYYIEIFYDAEKLNYKLASCSDGQYLNTQYDDVEVTDDIKSALNIITNSFKTEDSYLDCIMLYKDRISFVRKSKDEDRCYALVKMFTDQIPDFLIYPEEVRYISVKSIEENWYHVARQPYMPYFGWL